MRPRRAGSANTYAGRVGRWRADLALLALIVGAAAAIPFFLDLIRPFGHRIPQSAIEADYLAAWIWAIALGASIFFWPVSRKDRVPLLVLWAAKCLVALGFMLIYEWYYGLDAYGYFARSLQPESPLGMMGLARGSENVAALAWMHGQFVLGSYHAMKITFAMIGLVAIYLIYRAAVRFLGTDERRVLFAIGLFPSVLFWSSILGKDPVQLLGLALYVYGVVGWRCNGGLRSLAWIGLGILLAMSIRLWAGPILVLPLLIFALHANGHARRRIVFVVATLGALAVVVTRAADYFRLDTARDVYEVAAGISRGWEGGSQVRTEAPFESVGGMVAYAPVAAFTALFRPLPGEVEHVFGLLAGLENAYLLGLLCVALARARMRHLREPLVGWALLLVVGWSVTYGSTVYNLGALARFKLQVLPVLLLLLLYLGRRAQPGAPVGRVLTATGPAGSD